MLRRPNDASGCDLGRRCSAGGRAFLYIGAYGFAVAVFAGLYLAIVYLPGG